MGGQEDSTVGEAGLPQDLLCSLSSGCSLSSLDKFQSQVCWKTAATDYAPSNGDAEAIQDYDVGEQARD